VYSVQLNEAVSLVSDNAALLLSSTIALLGYIFCKISVARMGAHFSLGSLESVELDRALLLHEKVFDRLQDIRREGESTQWNPFVRYRHRKQVKREFAQELRDLQAYAGDLRSTILTLRSRPINHFKSWLHLQSSCFALSRSLVVCFLLLALLGACSYCLEQLSALEQLKLPSNDMGGVVASLRDGQLIPERVLEINSIGPCVLAVVAGLAYVYRRIRLRLQHGQHLRALKSFALGDASNLARRSGTPPPEDVSSEEPSISDGPSIAPDADVMAPKAPAFAGDSEKPCFSVLGLAPSATLDEIKQAYKAHVRQNHPDRVHGMSPVFRQLAEAQTKKLNTAYREALLSLQQV
jgi:hypothetical protein